MFGDTMGGATDSPRTVDELRTALATLEQAVADRDALIAKRDEQITRLITELERLRRLAFGPRSEKQRDAAVTLDEAMRGLHNVLPFPELERLQQAVDDAKASRDLDSDGDGDGNGGKDENKDEKKGKRRKRRGEIPADLPRKVTRIELPRELRLDSAGREMQEIGVEVTERLQYVTYPYVERIETVKYASPSDPDAGVVTAAAPPPVIEGGLLGHHMLAMIIAERFGNHMPYYRLEQKLRGEGLSISRSVLCSSALRCAELLEPVYRELRSRTLDDVLVQLDDTSVVVRHGRKAGRDVGHIWAYRNQRGEVFFDFTTDRSRDGPLAVLEEYSGYVQGDAYSGHDALFDGEGPNCTEVGCWAHARRKFKDAESTDPTLAEEILDLIRALYAIERRAKNDELDAEQRGKLRQAESKPLLAEIRDWCELALTKVVPKSPMAKAIGYVRNQWAALCRFAGDGDIEEIDNNRCEQALRSVAVGRKNWLFIGSGEKGQENAVLMSLIATCKTHGINPRDYLADVLVRISVETDVRRLVPMAWKADREAQQRVATSRLAITNVVSSFLGR